MMDTLTSTTRWLYCV